MRSVDPQQILPRMANVDEFALAGIEKLRFLSDVKFEVKPGSAGRGTIVLTSSAPVKEPFLNFLVEVNWPSGRLVREYTVLLDPPIYDPAPAPVAVQPARSSAVSAPAVVESQPMASQAPVNNIRTRMTDGQVYVDVNDTLWDIAKRHKPSNSVSEAQMMLALQRKNPNAFRNNNVNQLKAGVVMNLPTLEEVQALNQKQANEEFWRQTQMWKQGITPAAQPQQMDTSGNEGSADKAAATEKKGEEVAARSAQGQLKIVSPDTKADSSVVSDQAADADMSQADSALLEKNKQLETDLASALESVDQIQRENAELTGRVDALAQQMETLQRMLELKDQQLADLQAELETAKKQPVAAPAAPVVEPQVKPKSLLEEFGLYIGAAGGAIVAFLLALLFMRRGKKEDSAETIVPGQTIVEDNDATVVPAAAAAAAVVAASETVEADETVAEETDLDDLDLDLDMDLDKVDVAESNDIDEQEFDLGFDEDFGQPPAAAVAMEDEEEVDDALDSILGEDAESFDLDDLAGPSVVDDLGPLSEEIEEPEADSIEDLLAAGDAEEDVDAVDDADLEFDVEPLADISDVAEPAEELDDDLDLDFNLEVADAEDVGVDEDESLDLMMDDSVSDEDEEFADLDSLLGEDEAAPVAEDDTSDAELDALLAGVGEADVEELEVADTQDDDLDADLQALLDGADDEVVLDEEEFTAPQKDDSPLGHDLDAELDSELEMLLSDAGSDELSLDMTDDSEDDSLDGLNLLEGADEVETKLDLARAYIDMEDLDGAKDILEEIVKEGSESQRAEANSLLSSIS
ncbi:FimV/HubP family polar landmark protein [Amphritea sp.]|uniref:FimV/HubP family polar landmark protein n=1 Tax=Amphritea sp. TaxID=1872502 RepID=UPI003D0DB6E8